MNNDVSTDKIGMFARFRRYFLAGILVTSPILITVYVTWLIVTFVDTQVAGMLPESLDFTKKLPHQIPGLGLIISIIAITFIGAITPGFIGRTLLKSGERVLNKMPVVRSIYGAIKQIMETVMSTNSDSFREVVLVEYPRKGIWVIGFVTGETKGEVQSLTKDKVINIFVPTTPNPTSGFLLFIPQKDLVYMDMKVEDAVKMVISGGIVTPKIKK
ncbi:MAG: DUF502 domain-containing protein [Proteobacteria bacterium]|jgi:uncharacterized membrane protein|nr:DUF502 domain-containing protein [Pseudomonadota bacterium]MDA1136675.1 DUF502 domain-containing protein [Pseudomonadota bacterium]|tara:strand:- start:168 stop:812 length:645 start_codon:yes stop_codon:yes gene_type:complete